MRPVSYSSKSASVVEEFDRQQECDKLSIYWISEDISTLKKEIKDYYINEQQQTCCYCAKRFPTSNNAVWDAEHIIARVLEPKFMFEPRNLAIACKDCNLAKSDEEVRKNPKRKTFPDKGTDYIIIHPHFDIYDEHIEWFGEVCRAITEKGKSTIGMCDLMRYSLNRLGVPSFRRSKSFAKAVGDLLAAENRSEVDAAIGALGALARYIHQK